MKHTGIGALAALLLAAALCACGGGGAGQSAPEDSRTDSAAAADSGGPSLTHLLDNMADDSLYWEVELPGMDITTHHVAVDEGVRQAAARILSEHDARPEPDLLDDDTRDRAGEGVVFQLWASDDGGVYPNGSQLHFCVVLPLGENDPQAPGTTAVFVNNEAYEQDCYVLPSTVYGELLDLFAARVAETHAEPEGDHVRLLTSGGERYTQDGDLLQCGDILLQSRYEEARDYTGWTVEAFSLETGGSLYRIEADPGDGRGALLRMAGLRDIPDYDYCLFFEHGYAYRSGEDARREQYFPLPEAVAPVWRGGGGRPETYDEDGDYIAWGAQDGVHLRVAKQDGVTVSLILANEDAAALIPDPDWYSGALAFVSPRFLCAGTKVAAAIYSESQEQAIGVAVYDIASGTVTSSLAFVPPAAARYPVADRYVATTGLISDARLLDAGTGEVRDIPFLRISRSYDYRTFVLEDYQSLDARNAPSYVVEIDAPDDRSHPLLRATQPRAWMNLVDVTQEYAVFRVRDFDGEWYAAARYR